MSVVRSAVCVSFGKRLYAIWTAATVNIGCMSWKHPARVPQEMGCIRKDCNPVLLSNVYTLLYACANSFATSAHVVPGLSRKSGCLT